MKPQKTIMVLLTAALLVITPLSAMAGKGGKAGKTGKGKPPVVTVVLSTPQERELLFMREEEKLARDVYRVMYEEWDAPIFSNISEAEQTHMDALGRLVEKYGLEDPVENDDTGAITDPVLDLLYDELVANGEESLEAALWVGVFIEEVDIKDIEEAMAIKGTPADVIRTYENLLRGSHNHLRAFVSQWENLTGEVYKPTFLTEEEAEAILDGSAKRKKGRRGH